ncbi:ParB/RepB/Spo0J family partition protein [Comamonas sp. w2-DMI]|uniref:ParB/RepB/Spo0J family partition protein n=1 Tax=Comamonas sp. w2-DMI TaxID=3126391 RepID=UPI0032E42E7B
MALPGIAEAATHHPGRNVSPTALLDADRVAEVAQSLKKEETLGLHPTAQAIATSKAQNPPPQKIDPKKVRWSAWGNRLPERFQGPAFAEFVEDIRSTDGNKQPGVVRRLAKPDDKGYEYEIASGHRRHRACLEANKYFFAFVRELDDLALQDELETENRNRADTAPMERAIQYKRQMSSYRSQEHMAAAMKIPTSTMSRYLILAELPEEVQNLIEDRLQISLEGGCDLIKFMKSHPDTYKLNLEKLQAMNKKLPAKEVFKLLRENNEAKKTKITDKSVTLEATSGATFGTMTVNRAKQLKLSVDDITHEEFDKILEFVKKTCKRK